MRRIFISAGHTNVPGKDRGASGNGYVEGDLTVEFRDMVVDELKKIDNTVKVSIDANGNALKESLRYFRNLVSPKSLVVDIHWNAAVPQATGTEVLVPSNATNFETGLAHEIAMSISQTLGIRTRGNFHGLAGVKSESESHHGRLGWMRLTGQNVLIEMCFITNESDMRSYQMHKQELAERIACILYTRALTLDTSTNEVWHTIVRGDSLSSIAKKYNTTVKSIMTLNNLKSTIIYLGDKLKIK